VTGRDGYLDLTAFDRLLSPKTRILALTHVSNVLGTINPVAELAAKARAVGARVLVDAAQSVPHLALSVRTLGADFLAFSAHKMLGPTGIGALYARREILEEMDPFLGGGDMIKSVWKDRATWNDVPYKFEAGTPNIADAVAFGAAVDYLSSIGMDRVRAHEADLTGYALIRLRERFPRLVLHGPSDPAMRGGVVSFEYPGVHAHDVGTVLDREGVAVRAGHHCCQVLMQAFGIPGTARASFYLYNTRQEVDALVAALSKVGDLFEVKA
jgi:cysteine desulfurase/selenocysteine lyase